MRRSTRVSTKKGWDLQVQAEQAYFIIFALVLVLVLLAISRMIQAASKTISQLNYESERDKRQHERIARERERQQYALRRGTWKINGQSSSVQWDRTDSRAHRTYHIDEAADEVFDPVSNVRGMDVRVPWGWPGAKRLNGMAVQPRRRKNSASMGSAIANFFKPKQLVDEAYLARRERSIRSLVEDRYGRAGQLAATQMPDIEWSRPQLPEELLKERETDQILASKPHQGVESGSGNFRGLRVVADNADVGETPRKASGA